MKVKLDENKPLVRKLRKSLADIQKQPSDKIDKEPVSEETTTALELNDVLCSDVNQYCDSLDRQLEKANKFFNGCDKIRDWAPGMEDKIKEIDVEPKSITDLQADLKELDVSYCFN